MLVRVFRDMLDNGLRETDIIASCTHALVVAVADPERCGHVLVDGGGAWRCSRNRDHRGAHRKVRTPYE